MIIEKLKDLLQHYAGTNEPAPLAAGVVHYNMFNEECGGRGSGGFSTDCNCGLFNCNCDCDCSSDCDDDYDDDCDCEYGDDTDDCTFVD